MNIRMAVLAITLGVSLAGCASPGYKQADRAGSSMAETTAALDRGIKQVDADLAALDSLVAARDGNLRPAYKKYSSQVDETEAAAEKGRKRVAALRERADEHFESWVKETESIANPELREAAGARRTQARQAFGALTDSLDQVKVAYDPFIADLRDIRTALGSDLTAAGVNAASPTISKAKSNGQKLKDAIARAQAAVANFRSQIVSPR